MGEKYAASGWSSSITDWKVDMNLPSFIAAFPSSGGMRIVSKKRIAYLLLSDPPREPTGHPFQHMHDASWRSSDIWDIWTTARPRSRRARTTGEVETGAEYYAKDWGYARSWIWTSENSSSRTFVNKARRRAEVLEAGLALPRAGGSGPTGLAVGRGCPPPI